MVHLYDHVLAQDDPFEYVYECISGTHGTEAMNTMTEMYANVAIDYNLHPDDDFEKIIAIMLDYMED